MDRERPPFSDSWQDARDAEQLPIGCRSVRQPGRNSGYGRRNFSGFGDFLARSSWKSIHVETSELNKRVITWMKTN